MRHLDRSETISDHLHRREPRYVARRCGRDGMVDIPDLKSEGRMPVGVRVPPPAPPFMDNRFDFDLSLAAV